MGIWRRIIARAIVAMAIFAVGAAETAADVGGRADFAPLLAAAWPGADTLGPVAGTPPSARVYRDGQLVGYLFSTYDVVGSVGFSGQPLDIVVGLDLAGRIAGAVLHRHNEPVLVIGVPEQQLSSYVAAFAGLDITGPMVTTEANAASALPDAIAGATISSGVMRDAVIRAARAVARQHGIIATPQAGAALRREIYEAATWDELVADGSLARMQLTKGEVSAALRQQSGIATPDPAGPVQSEALFIELFAGLATPARIGQNLLGRLRYTALAAALGPADHLVIVAGSGAYSFKGTQYRRSGVFDRLQIVQDGRTIRLGQDGYENIERLFAAGAPELREIGLFRLPASTGFDPLQDWQLELLVERDTGDGGKVLLAFPLDYRLPAFYRSEPPAPAPSGSLFGAGDADGAAHWQRNWIDRIPSIAALTAMLVVLTAILVFQDALVRRPKLYRQVRLWYLAVTLFWLGLYAGAQLSVFNVLTFAHSLLTGFRWEFFLLDPLIFILWSYVAVALLFWGRGVFCGWLCPFGALQELLNEVARLLHIPQIKVPFGLHERLWPIKHIMFLGLLAVSLHSMAWAVLGTEVEPFKTAITLKFIRDWPFVLYAVALLLAGLFIERFFCRYLCPLGAALAIPARLRMFEWLKRRFQCGHDCQICAMNCTVQAIHPTGEINPNECIYCLACQANYSNEHLCPPLVQRRRRRERLQAGNAALAEPETS